MKKIILAAVFAFVLVTNAFVQTRNEVWNDIASINDIVGKWEGSVVQKIPGNRQELIPDSSIEIIIYFDYVRNSKKIDITLKVDMGKFLSDWLKMDEIKALGLTRDDMWDLFLETINYYDEISDVGKYYIAMKMTMDVNLAATDSSFFSSDEGEFKINAGKNKLKLIFFEAISFGMGDSGFNEVILNKK